MNEERDYTILVPSDSFPVVVHTMPITLHCQLLLKLIVVVCKCKCESECGHSM